MDENSFLAMGGYALYVWLAYGIAALVLIAMTIASVCRLRRVRRDLMRLESDGGTRDAGALR